MHGAIAERRRDARKIATEYTGGKESLGQFANLRVAVGALREREFFD